MGKGISAPVPSGGDFSSPRSPGPGGAGASSRIRWALVPEMPKEIAAKPEPKRRVKNDPRLVAAARELRDRWLEEVNAGRFLPASNGKYDVSKALAAPTVEVVATIPVLPAPIAA